MEVQYRDNAFGYKMKPLPKLVVFSIGKSYFKQKLGLRD